MDSAPTPESGRKRRVSTRLALTGAVVLLGVAGIGGVFANFTDTATGGPTPLTTGVVHITLGTPTGDKGGLTAAPVNNLAEGDSVARVVQVTNATTVGAAGTTGLAATNGLTLQATVPTGATDDIVTDATNGYQVKVQSCATAPTEAGGTTGPWTYTCTGGFTSVATTSLKALAAGPVDITSAAPIEGASTYYVVTVSLPTTLADAYSTNGGVCSTAGAPYTNEQFQNCAVSVGYNFTATQRAGASQ